MACGIPVVATESAGTRDIVRDAVDGLLVERHEPAAVAAALERVLGDTAVRQAMSGRARETASKLEMLGVAAHYTRVLNEAWA